MRNIIALAAMAAAVLPAVASQAQTVDICDRTQHVLDAILDAVDADDCAAVDSDSLAGVYYLPSFGPGRVTALRAGDFDGLASLRELNLPRHLLTTLPAGVFDGLTSLESLKLGWNELTTLRVGVFDGLTSLLQLHLHDNRLTTLPLGVFNGLTSLRDLHLSSNRLTTLPDGVFDGLTRLRSLELRGNQLNGLPDGVDDLIRLRHLDLSYNRLTTLPTLPAGLHSLWLCGNETTLADSVFWTCAGTG